MGLFKGLFDLALGEGAYRDVFGPTKQERRVRDDWVQSANYKPPTREQIEANQRQAEWEEADLARDESRIVPPI